MRLKLTKIKKKIYGGSMFAKMPKAKQKHKNYSNYEAYADQQRPQAGQSQNKSQKSKDKPKRFSFSKALSKFTNTGWKGDYTYINKK
jgi:hypothetical protein